MLPIYHLDKEHLSICNLLFYERPAAEHTPVFFFISSKVTVMHLTVTELKVEKTLEKSDWMLRIKIFSFDDFTSMFTSIRIAFKGCLFPSFLYQVKDNYIRDWTIAPRKV